MKLQLGGAGLYKGEIVVRFLRIAKQDHRPYPRHLVCDCGSREFLFNVRPVERKRHIRCARRLRVQAVCHKCGRTETVHRGGLRLTTER